MRNVKSHQGTRAEPVSNVTYAFNLLGAPSDFPMENNDETVVVSRERRMEREILRDGYQWPLSGECRKEASQ